MHDFNQFSVRATNTRQHWKELRAFLCYISEVLKYQSKLPNLQNDVMYNPEPYSHKAKLHLEY